MSNVEHVGYVLIEDKKHGATFRIEGDKLQLEVMHEGGVQAHRLPERIEIAHFRGSKNYFTLARLFRTNLQSRLGVGGLCTYSVRLAFEDVLFPTLDEIASKTWTIYIEDIHKILHVIGLNHSFIVSEDDTPIVINWSFSSPRPVTLTCSSVKLLLKIGQDMHASGDVISGPSITLRYPLEVIAEEDVPLDAALDLLKKVQLFFSLMMGRVLAIDEISLRVIDGDDWRYAKVYGILETERSQKPTERLVDYDGVDGLASLLDQWLVKFDLIKDAVYLHMSALEQRKLPLQMRFQIFVQALEALHRRTSSLVSTPVDVPPIIELLRKHGIPDDVTDRVSGVLAHAHEPGLRQRLNEYWTAFSTELEIMRPQLTKKGFISRVVATRNHYAHRTDKDNRVLEAAELWDHSELVKAICHLALMQEIGATTAEMGRLMVRNRFAEFTVAT